MKKIKNKNWWIYLIVGVISVHIQLYAVLTINKSGVYKLRSNETDGITISANDVVLDLGGYVVSNNDLTGIDITSGYSDIIIKNGTVRGPVAGTTYGIDVNASCSRITLKNLSIEGWTSGSLRFIGSLGNEITDSCVEDCLATGHTATGSHNLIYLNYCERVQFKNCRMSENGPSSVLDVFQLDYCNACSFENIMITNNLPGSSINCMLLTDSNNIICQNWFIASNTSTSFKGFDVSGYGNVFKDITIVGNTCSGVTSDFVGARTSGGYSTIFDHIIITDNTCPANMWGFEINDRDVIITDCVITNNVSTDVAEGQYLGIYLRSATNNHRTKIIRTLVAGMNNETGPSTNYGITTGNGNYHIYDQCLVHDCQAASGAYGYHQNGSTRATGCFGYDCATNVYSSVSNTATIAGATSGWENAYV